MKRSGVDFCVEIQNNLLPWRQLKERACSSANKRLTLQLKREHSGQYQAIVQSHGPPGTDQKQEHLLRIATDGRKLPTPVLSGSGRGYNLSPTHGAPLFHCDHSITPPGIVSKFPDTVDKDFVHCDVVHRCGLCFNTTEKQGCSSQVS
jgi:hypothetical protein